jgi:tetratricopeptide (TPR) repeat protein
MVQTPIKWLVLLGGLGFFIVECLKSFAQDDDPGVLNQQVFQLYQQGKIQDAIRMAERALEVAKRARGREHLETAGALNNFGFLLKKIGDYAKAEPLYQEALRIRRKAFGPEHPDTASSLNNLAELYRAMGDYGKAEPLCQEALRIRRKVLGSENPDTATSLDNLAMLYKDMGDYAKAEPLCQEALRIHQKVFGSEHPDTARSLNNLAVVYQTMGDYAKAEPLYQEALRIRQKVRGPEHPDTASTFNNLAGLYREMGEYAKAEPLYQEALRIRQKVLGSEHPDTATSLDNLAMLYTDMRDHAKAEPLYQEALRIRQKVFGSEHPDTAISLNNMAVLYLRMGDYVKAEPLYQEALRIRQKVFGLEHPDTAISLNNMAVLYLTMGDYVKAEPLCQEAPRILKKVLGPEHRETATSLTNLALLEFDLGRIDEATAVARQASAAELAILSKIFSFTSEQQRLAYLDIFRPYSLFPFLKGTETDLAAAVLRYKGVVLDSIIEDRLLAKASQGSEDQKLVEQLNLNKRQLGQLLLQPAQNVSDKTNRRIEALEGEVEGIESQLALHVAGLGQVRHALSVSLDQVQSTIPEDGALIEYLRYPRYFGKGKWEQRYGAIVLASTGKPSWIPLSDAGDVDAIVSQYQRLVRDASDQEELSTNLEKLYGKLWEPIKQSLPREVRRIIISPDSQLNFVSFATLLEPKGGFLAEKYAIQYAASGRDFLSEVKPATGTEAIVFANPNFDLSPSQTIATADDMPSDTTAGIMRGVEKRNIEDLIFIPLGGSQIECDDLTNEFESWHLKADSFTGKYATKEALLRIHSPYILHLATHGFFEPATKSVEQQPDSSQQSVTKSKFFKNPMHCSGLALAGANVTLEAWQHGEAPPVGNDGIVTAEDVAGLDLRSTWLVTLSACDSGSGETKAGEGVLGLRRGFIQAGTQHLLMTLWPISDAVTVEIMRDLYEAAHTSGNAPLALAEVQREWLLQLREGKGEKFDRVEHIDPLHPHCGLANAVNLAGAFIMSSQGKP